jgi:hypothetical protein
VNRSKALTPQQGGPDLIIRLLVAAAFGIGDLLQAGAMLRGIKARAERERESRG